jgi:hypothetical protein
VVPEEFVNARNHSLVGLVHRFPGLLHAVLQKSDVVRELKGAIATREIARVENYRAVRGKIRKFTISLAAAHVEKRFILNGEGEE